MDVVSRGGAVRRRVQENNETRFTDRYLSESFEFILYLKRKRETVPPENIHQFQPAYRHVLGRTSPCGCVRRALKHYTDDNKSHAEYALHPVPPSYYSRTLFSNSARFGGFSLFNKSSKFAVQPHFRRRSVLGKDHHVSIFCHFRKLYSVAFNPHRHIFVVDPVHT